MTTETVGESPIRHWLRLMRYTSPIDEGGLNDQLKLLDLWRNEIRELV